MPVLSRFSDRSMRTNVGYSPSAPNYYPDAPSTQPQSSGFDIGMLIQVMTTLPTLRKSGDTLTKAIDALNAVAMPDANKPEQLAGYIVNVRNQLGAALGADRDAFAALRQGILLDLLPALLSGGAAGNNGMGLIMMMLIFSGGSGNSLFG